MVKIGTLESGTVCKTPDDKELGIDGQLFRVEYTSPGRTRVRVLNRTRAVTIDGETKAVVASYADIGSGTEVIVIPNHKETK